MIRASLFFLILSTLSFAAAPAKLPAESKSPLNLAELSAKDTASFETYSQRIALVQDSILATQKEIEIAKKKPPKQVQQLIKPLADRLSELEKAKKQIEENQNSLYCTLDISTYPEAASIYYNKEEIGASPAEYNLALPGYAVIRIQKENYDPWDTTLILQPAQKLKLNIALQEKSIFSDAGYINFFKTLAKDTTVEGYLNRIDRVKARIAQIDYEIRIIFENFPDAYPALDPQTPEETLQDFERRKSSWQYDGEKLVRSLVDKYKSYKAKLTRSIETLEDNIIATESRLITEPRPNARITLGNYDTEKETFELDVQDTANVKSPFHFVGKVVLPRDTAKIMNRSTEGFLAGVSYLNYPFVSRDSSFNLAMKELALSRKAIPLKVYGEFKPINKFQSMEGYGPWQAHANSLLNGSLKPQGLDLNYALKGEKPQTAASAAVASTEAGSGSGGGLGWRGWTRILTFTAAVGLGAATGVMQIKAKDNKKKFNTELDEEPKRVNNNVINTNYEKEYREWYSSLESKKTDVEKNRTNAVIFGAGAGVFAVTGILTFIF